jgi:hypothetical protein
MAVTIKDVSAKCGLSISTVSKAFNNYADISLETRELVQRTAREIGYYPNAIARTLKTNRSYNLGVLFQEKRSDAQLLRFRAGCVQVGGGEARVRHHLHQPPHRVDGHDLSGALPIPQCRRRVRRLR